MVNWSSVHKRVPFVAVVAWIVATGAFLAFVGLYPALFPSIERACPERVQEKVDQALREGKVGDALQIAQAATAWDADDPITHTVYGQLLREQGDEAAARAQFEAAGKIETAWGADFQRAQNPFAFAEARLELGSMALNRGPLAEALSEFELARAYSPFWGDECRVYHPALYTAYATAELWHRALDFGRPDVGSLSALSDEQLLRLARVCEGRKAWELARPVCAGVLGREAGNADAYFISGRALMASGDVERARKAFEEAGKLGHTDAPFFVGMLRERAGGMAAAAEAYWQTGTDSLYRPLAVAKLLDAIPPTSPNEYDRLLEAMRREFLRERGWGQPRGMDAPRRFTIDRVQAAGEYLRAGGPFPLLVVWTDTQSSQPSNAFRVEAREDGTGTVWLGRQILDVFWTENLVLSPDFGATVSAPDVVPGWYELQLAGSRSIEADPSGERFLRVQGRDSETGISVLSVPVHVRQGMDYLVAGRIRAPEAGGIFGWECLDGNERDAGGVDLVGKTVVPTWTLYAAHMRAQAHWSRIYIELGMDRGGPADFNHLLLVAFEEPIPWGHTERVQVGSS
ncbi:MAG TPA: hypothetical protein PLO37_16510 [Candidatus Hydrogenedentes bacterium]|nr:hypothetical protein [Candidatus Hydrogenedentota bacterium]HPG68449.1 hypothetical protein [Candidatus Hydrogenedentota bacterium]